MGHFNIHVGVPKNGPPIAKCCCRMERRTIESRYRESKPEVEKVLKNIGQSLYVRSISLKGDLLAMVENERHTYHLL